MSAREIVGHLHELCGIEVSPDLVSTVTDAMLDGIAAWQARPLEPVYPLVFFDALRVKVRDEGWFATRSCTSRSASAPTAPRRSSVSGSSGTRAPARRASEANFWLRDMNELKTRGVEDVLLAVVDGPKGFPEAITAVFPEATVQPPIGSGARSASSICCGPAWTSSRGRTAGPWPRR